MWFKLLWSLKLSGFEGINYIGLLKRQLWYKTFFDVASFQIKIRDLNQKSNVLRKNLDAERVAREELDKCLIEKDSLIDDLRKTSLMNFSMRDWLGTFVFRAQSTWFISVCCWKTAPFWWNRWTTWSQTSKRLPRKGKFNVSSYSDESSCMIVVEFHYNYFVYSLKHRIEKFDTYASESKDLKKILDIQYEKNDELSKQVLIYSTFYRIFHVLNVYIYDYSG